MPFKSGENFEKLNKNIDGIVDKISNQQLDRSLYIAATIGAGYAATATPIDTSTLINSQYITQPVKTTDVAGKRVEVGYTANYALYVHNFEDQPNPTPRPDGNGFTWDPNGEPYFLLNGFEQNEIEIRNAFFEGMKI